MSVEEETTTVGSSLVGETAAGIEAADEAPVGCVKGSAVTPLTVVVALKPRLVKDDVALLTDVGKLVAVVRLAVVISLVTLLMVVLRLSPRPTATEADVEIEVEMMVVLGKAT